MTLIVDVNIVVLSTPPFSTYILLTLAYVLSAVSLAKCIAIFLVIRLRTLFIRTNR